MALRSPLTVQPYDYIADSNGRPLDHGQVYIGVANQDPEFYQIPVYLDAAMTKPIDQPIRTNDGFVDFAGSLSELYASAEVYSVKVLDKQGRKVIYKAEMMRDNLTDDALQSLNTAIGESQQAAENTLNETVESITNNAINTVNDAINDAINNTAVEGGVLADTFVTVTANGVGTVARTQRDKNSDYISADDLGLVDDGATNNSPKIAQIESGLSNKKIDLLGKTLIVDSVPTGNEYFNGYFKVADKVYETTIQPLKSGNGIVRINGGGNIPLDYKKNIDKFGNYDAVVAIGDGALDDCTAAGQTIAIGASAMMKTKQSYMNIAIGHSSMRYIQSADDKYSADASGTRNIAIGSASMLFMNNGVRNISIGRNTGAGIKNMSDVVLLGSGALSGKNANGWYKEVESQLGNTDSNAKIVAIGGNALVEYTGRYAVAVGHQAGFNLKAGTPNTLIGVLSGYSLEGDVGWEGYERTVYGAPDVGLEVPYIKEGNNLIVTVPNHSCVVGSSAQIRWKSGKAFPEPPHWHAWRQEVIATTVDTVTFHCPYDNGDGSGVAVIYWSLNKAKDVSESRHNTLIGHRAAYSAKKGNYTTLVGSGVLQQAAEVSHSVLMGADTANAATGVYRNAVVVGTEALQYSTSDSLGTVAIGYRALRDAEGDIDMCTAIGTQAGVVMQDGSKPTVSLKNSVLLGANTSVSGAGQVQLGRSGTSVYAYGAIQDRSDKRDKIIEGGISDDLVNFFNDVEFTRFRWDYREDYREIDEDGNVTYFEKDGTRAGKRQHLGVIAQQVEEVMHKHGVDFAGLQHHAKNGGNDVYTVGYQEFIPLLGEIVQRQQKQIDELIALIKK